MDDFPHSQKPERLSDILTRIEKRILTSAPDNAEQPPAPSPAPVKPLMYYADKELYESILARQQNGHRPAPDAPVAHTANLQELPTKAVTNWEVSHKPLGGDTQGSAKKSAQQHALAKDDIVRPDLVIEKHADILFAPAHAKNLHKPRSRAWVATLPDGTHVKALVYEDIYRGRVCTTTTHKVALALEKIHEESDQREDGRAISSFRKLADTLGWKWGGKKTVQELMRELDQLRFTPFIEEYAYIDKDGLLTKPRDTFTILDDLKTVTREKRNAKDYFAALVAFRFSETIRNRRLANARKPTLLNVFINIKGEIASALYARFDVILADNERYEHRTKELFEILKLEGEKEYRYPSGRKRQLEKAIKELNGKPLSCGGVLSLDIKKTVDGKDYKLIAWKEPIPDSRPARKVVIPRKPANPTADVSYIIDEMRQAVGYDDDLYGFYAKTYPMFPVIARAIAEYKADRPTNGHSPIKYFSTILHRIAHHHGYEWIKPCLSDCALRPKSSEA